MPSVNVTQLRNRTERRNSKYDFEPDPTWKGLLDRAEHARCQDSLLEFDDYTEERGGAAYSPTASRALAETIVEKLESSLGGHSGDNELPVNERTAAGLVTYIRTHCPKLNTHISSSLIK